MTDEELERFAQQQGVDNGQGSGDDFEGYIQQFGWDLDAQRPMEGAFADEEADPRAGGHSAHPGMHSTSWTYDEPTPWAYDQHGFVKGPMATQFIG